MRTRQQALQDLANRIKSLKELPEWHITRFQEKRLFTFKADIQQLCINDYGKLCEIAYIIYLADVTELEFAQIVKENRKCPRC